MDMWASMVMGMMAIGHEHGWTCGHSRSWALWAIGHDHGHVDFHGHGHDGQLGMTMDMWTYMVMGMMGNWA
jgi:hypothetical protein